MYLNPFQQWLYDFEIHLFTPRITDGLICNFYRRFKCSLMLQKEKPCIKSQGVKTFEQNEDVYIFLVLHVFLQLIYSIYIYIYIYTDAGHIIRISSKSWFISLIPFKKWNLYNVYIHSTQTDIFQAFISFNFDDYNWQLMKTSNSVSQKIWILFKTNTKKGFLEILANWKVWTCTALNT